MNTYAKIDTKDLIAENFHYGMEMTGKLWPHEGDQILIEINSEHMNLIYPYKSGYYSEIVKQKILLEWNSRTYGSKGMHFICPDCGKKVTALNNRGIFFLCRNCSNSAYKMKYEEDTIQMHRIQEKLEKESTMFHVWK